MKVEIVPQRSDVQVDDGNTTVVVQPVAEAVVVTAPGPQGIPGIQGPAGESIVGPQGPAGESIVGPKGDPGDVAVLTYTHNQDTASALWTIEHGKGFFLNVTVVDSAGTEVVGDVVFQDANTVVIQFAAPFSGKAYLS